MDRVLVGTEREIAAHRVEVRGPQGSTERIRVRDVGGIKRRQQQVGCVEPLAGIQRRQAAVGLFKARDKSCVGGVVQILAPLRGVPDTQGGVAHGLKNALVKAERRSHHGDVNAAARVLLEEADPHAAGKKEIDAVRIAGADLCDFGGIVRLAQLGIDFGRNLAVVKRLEPGQRIGARRVIRRQKEGVFISRDIGIGAAAVMQAVVLPGHVEVVLVAPAPGQRRWPGIR